MANETEGDFLAGLGAELAGEGTKAPEPSVTAAHGQDVFGDRRRQQPPAGFQRNAGAQRVPLQPAGDMGDMLGTMAAHADRQGVPPPPAARAPIPDHMAPPPRLHNIPNNVWGDEPDRIAHMAAQTPPSGTSESSTPRRESIFSRLWRRDRRSGTSEPDDATPPPADAGRAPLTPPDVPPVTPDPDAGRPPLPPIPPAPGTPEHLRGGRIVRGHTRSDIPERLRNMLTSTFTKETALFIGAVGTGLAARKLGEITGLTPDMIANFARLIPVVGSVSGAITGFGGVLEMRGLRKAASARTDRAEEVWQQNMKVWRTVRRVSEFIALASFADKIASAGQAAENAFANAISHHDTEPTATPHATSTPHKTETPTPTATPHKTEIPTATATPIPTPTEPHGGLGTGPTATSTEHPPTATPVPTVTPTPAPVVVPTPAPSGPDVPGGGTGTPGTGPGNTEPLHNQGFALGAHAISSVIEHPNITQPTTPDNPIATPGHPGFDPGITPPEAPPGSEPLAHFDFTAHGHHITGNAYDNSYMFDDKHWNLEGNFTDHYIDIPPGMHIDHTALQTALNQFVDGYANDTLEPGSVAYDVGHYANGTASVYDQIAHNPQFTQHLIDAHILVPDQPAAVVPEIHPVPLEKITTSISDQQQTTAATHVATAQDQAVEKLATLVADKHIDTSQTATPVAVDTTADTHLTTQLGNGGISPLNEGTPTFPTDTQAGIREFHTGPIEHIQSPVNGHIVNGQLGDPDNPLTYQDKGETTPQIWDLQNPQKEADAIAYLQNHGISVDYDQVHKGIEFVLEDAAYQQVNNKLDDYSPEGLLFHWFNGTESMQEFFKQNPEALQQAFEQLAQKHPDLLPIGIGVAPSELPPNVIPFPGQKVSNVVPFPNANGRNAA